MSQRAWKRLPSLVASAFTGRARSHPRSRLAYQLATWAAGVRTSPPGPGLRFAADAVAALPASSTLPTASTSQPLAVPRLSIVVLPLTSLSDDRDQQYFADGVTEDLTTDLSNIAGMLVISCNSAFTYKGKSVTAKQVGRELGVVTWWKGASDGQAIRFASTPN